MSIALENFFEKVTTVSTVATLVSGYVLCALTVLKVASLVFSQFGLTYGAGLFSSTFFPITIIGTVCYTFAVLGALKKGEDENGIMAKIAAIGVGGLTAFVISKLASPVFGGPLDTICRGLVFLSAAPTVFLALSDFRDVLDGGYQKSYIYESLLGK